MPGGIDPCAFQSVFGCPQRLVQGAVEVRHHAGQGGVGADAQQVTRLAGKHGIGAPALDKTIEEALLALKVAPLQPRTLTTVRIHKSRVLHIERGPDLLPGYEEHMVVDVQVRVVPLLEKCLPQHPGSQAVCVEDQLHRDALAGPATAGLSPDVDRLVLGVGKSGQSSDPTTDVFAGACTNLGTQLRPGRIVVVVAIFQERKGDAVRNGIGAVQQRLPTAGDLSTKFVVDDSVAGAGDLLPCEMWRGSHEYRFSLSAQICQPGQRIRAICTTGFGRSAHIPFCAHRPRWCTSHRVVVQGEI